MNEKEEWMNGLDGQQQLRIRFPKSNYPLMKDLHYQGELIPLGIQAPHSEWGSPGQLWVAQCRTRLAEVSGWPEAPTANEVSLSSPALRSGFSPGKWPSAGTAIHQWRGTQCLDRGLENTGTIRTTSALRGSVPNISIFKDEKSRPRGVKVSQWLVWQLSLHNFFFFLAVLCSFLRS